MKFSEREKKLLSILAILIVLALPYFLIISPLINATADVRAEVMNLEAEYEELITLQEKSSVYQNATADYQERIEELLHNFPAELAQESTLMFISNAENLFHVSLYQIAFGEVTDMTEFMEAADIDKYTVKSVSTSFTYHASYYDFKRFINYIEQYQERMVITDLTASYIEEEDMVNGSFTLVQYAIGGRDRIFPETVVGLSLGTENIFTEAAGTMVTDTEQLDRYDYFIMLSNPGADIDAKMVGKANDASKQSYLTSVKNAQEKIVITFMENAGEYTVCYAIGDRQFPTEDFTDGIVFVPGDSLDLQIISSPRVGKEDNVSADIEVNNKTDMPLKVHVINDDTKNPRVTFIGKTGDVLVYE